MNRKVCIITGANSGIGKQAAIQMAIEGYHVIIACRNKERGEEALSEIKVTSKSDHVELMILDLSLISSTESFAEAVKERFVCIDVLIHNAAIFNITQKEAILTREGYETVWMTNHINPVRLTYLLMDQIKKSDQGRVITIASKGLLAKPFLRIDLKDPEYKLKKFNITNAYYQSKLAQIIFTHYLADKLKETPITVNAIRVPAVKVDMSRHSDLSNFMQWVYKQKSKWSIEPVQMAKTYIYLAISTDLADVTGKYFDENNMLIDANKYTKDKKSIEELMALTHEYMPGGFNGQKL